MMLALLFGSPSFNIRKTLPCASGCCHVIFLLDFINKDTLIHSPTEWLMRNRELAFGLDRTDDGERSPHRRWGDKSELGLALDKPKLSNAPPM